MDLRTVGCDAAGESQKSVKTIARVTISAGPFGFLPTDPASSQGGAYIVP